MGKEGKGTRCGEIGLRALAFHWGDPNTGLHRHPSTHQGGSDRHEHRIQPCNSPPRADWLSERPDQSFRKAQSKREHGLQPRPVLSIGVELRRLAQRQRSISGSPAMSSKTMTKSWRRRCHLTLLVVASLWKERGRDVKDAFRGVLQAAQSDSTLDSLLRTGLLNDYS